MIRIELDGDAIARQHEELRASEGDFTEALGEVSWGNLGAEHRAFIAYDDADLGRLIRMRVDDELMRIAVNLIENKELDDE
jgi:hypothetical protein